MTACPGCGVVLPGSGEPWDPRSLASEACQALYGEVAGYESHHLLELGRWHQLLVDAYAAQHAGEATPAIGTAFALIGLHLALDAGRDGRQVRDAHRRLAATGKTWPRFSRPAGLGDLTIFDVALARSPDEHIANLRAWAAAVWAAWADAHDAVRALVRTHADAVGSRV